MMDLSHAESQLLVHPNTPVFRRAIRRKNQNKIYKANKKVMDISAG